MIRRLFLCIILLLEGVNRAKAQKTNATVLGTWKGTSLCMVKPSACHDETVVYEFTASAGAKGHVVANADRIEDGKRVNMGALDCAYAGDPHTITCDLPGLGVWTFTMEGDAMSGTLKRSDGTLFRKVSAQRETTDPIAALRSAYEAFNRGDIEAAVRMLDEDVEWIEPREFPGGGTYHGIEGAKQYLAQSRAGAAQVVSEPEKFLTAGDRIVVFVHARVLPKDGTTWQDVRLADVYRFRNGKAIEMHAFADRNEALRWVGLKEEQ